MDPFLDDSVTMAKRLKSLGKSVGLDVLSGLPHGFLSFINVIIYSSEFHHTKQPHEVPVFSLSLKFKTGFKRCS